MKPGAQTEKALSPRAEKLRTRAIQLGLVFILVLVFSMPLLVVAQYGQPVASQHYSRTFLFHAGTNDYSYDFVSVSTFDASKDAKVTISTSSDRPEINIKADNIRVMNLDFSVLWEDYSDDISTVLEAKGYDAETAEAAFAQWSSNMLFLVETSLDFERLIIDDFPIGVAHIEIDGTVWKVDTQGDSVTVSLPKDKTNYAVKVQTQESEGQDASSIEDILRREAGRGSDVFKGARTQNNIENTVATTAIVAGLTFGVSAAASSMTSSLAAGVAATGAQQIIRRLFDPIVNFFQEIGEESLRDKTVKGLEGGRPSFITKEEMASIGFSIFVLALAVAYMEMITTMNEGKIYFLNTDIFDRSSYDLGVYIKGIPIALASITVIVLFMEFSSEMAARFQGIWSEFRVWPIGVVTLIVSAIFLLNPFASPGRSTYRSNIQLPLRISAFVALAKCLALLTLVFPFVCVYILGGVFESITRIGLSVSLMIFTYTLLPFRPLDGVDVYEWNRKVWAVLFFTGIAMFFSFQMGMFQVSNLVPISFLVVGASAGVVLIQLQYHLWLNKSEYTVEELQAIYEEYNQEAKQRRLQEEAEAKKETFSKKIMASLGLGKKKSTLRAGSAGRTKCPKCKTVVERDWLVCPVCDHKLHRR